MKAMIMAAGVGSRLMPMTISVPKPMIPMANRPLMENIIDVLIRHDFTDVIANLHYHGDIIKDYFGDGRGWGLSMRYSPEDELMGTAGGVKKCQDFLDETFVVISGDALTDIDLTYLMTEHRRLGALATIALKQVDEVEQFGVVITDANGRIERFQEKPKAKEALSRTANTGIYIFEPEIFELIPDKQFYDFGKQLFPLLVQQKAPFYGVEINNYWCDIGNINTYRQANADILSGKVKVKYKGEIEHIDEQTALLIGEDTLIGRDVSIRGQVVIGPGCRVADGVSLENSVIWNDTLIEEGAVIKDAVVGSACRIGQSACLYSFSTIASGSYLNDGAIIEPDSKQ